MKNSQLVENTHGSTDRAVEFMKIYGLALFVMMAVSVLVHTHPAFTSRDHTAIELQAKQVQAPTATLVVQHFFKKTKMGVGLLP